MRRSIRDLVRAETWAAQAAVHRRAVWSYEATLDEGLRVALFVPLAPPADYIAWPPIVMNEDPFAKWLEDMEAIVDSGALRFYR